MRYGLNNVAGNKRWSTRKKEKEPNSKPKTRKKNRKQTMIEKSKKRGQRHSLPKILAAM